MSSATELQVPPKLVDVFTDAPGEIVRYRGAYGGRGSAKTRTFALMAAVHGYRCGRRGLEGIILCAREFMNSLDESSLEEVKAAIRSVPWLNAYYQITERTIRSRDGRVRFAFTGLRVNLDSIKSKSRILLCWVDEAEPVSRSAWTKLIPTVREDNSEIWVTWNPESDESETHKRFRLDPPARAKIVEMNWRDNPYFPGVLDMERLTDKAKRPDEYEHIWEGAFASVTEGAYYARHLLNAEREGRIRSIQRQRHLPLITSWDLGVDDYTAIWLWQEDGVNAYVLDFYEAQGEGAEHYAEIVKGWGALDGKHYVPHDVRAREWGAGARSRAQTLIGLGLKRLSIGAAMNPEDRVTAVRSLLPDVVFNDTVEVQRGIARLRRYKRKFNEQMKVWQGPLHDENSHAADAFGEFAVNGPLRQLPEPPEPAKTVPPGAVRMPARPKPGKMNGGRISV